MTASVWNPNPNTVTQANAKGTLKQELLNASVGQRIFQLTTFSYAINTGALLVFKNGKALVRNKDFLEVDGTSVILAGPTDDDDEMLFMGFVGLTGTVADDPILRADLVSANGSDIVSFIQKNIDAVKRNLQDKVAELAISVTDFTNSRGDGVTSNSYALQKACSFANAIGGGTVVIPNPKVAWVMDFPVFVQNNTKIVGSGSGCVIIVKNPTYAKGRGGFVFGSSLEANRTIGLAAYANGTYPAATTRNNAYVNPALKQYLRDNPQFTEAKNSSIRDVYLIAKFDNAADWGGYGINFVNAWNCHAENIWGEGWTQLIGMGSDVAPETPSNHMCSAKNLHVIKPDLVHTYYSIGFISNSTNCKFETASQYMTIPVGTDDGNGAAIAYAENCQLLEIGIPDLGRTTNSQGFMLNSTKNCRVDRCFVGNAKTAFATYFIDGTYNDANSPNILGPDLFARGCDKPVELGAKFAVVLGIKNVNCIYDIAFLNNNATNNTVACDVAKVYTPADQTRRQYFVDNTIKGWRPRDIYFRPVSLLVSDKSSDTSSYDIQKNVKAVAGKSLVFLWPVPADIKAIGGVQTYITYADNAQAAASTFKTEVRRMVGFNGNSGEAPYVEATYTDAANNAVTVDKLIQLSPIFVETADTSHGLPYSIDVCLTLAAPTQFSTVKEVKITCFGE